MSNSKLVSYTKISPNSSARTAPISKITIHHMAGNLSVENCGNIFASPSRQASSNYGIGSDGRIALYVDESRRAWTSSNRDNDNVAVTIEVANCGGAPNWPISDKAMEALIALCADICKRNKITRLNYTGDKNGNLTRHNMFAATGCPGPYLQSKFPYIAERVNSQLTTIYRVRKSWDDVKSQIGAFSDYDNATKMVDKNPGYFVFDEGGNALYPEGKDVTVSLPQLSYGSKGEAVRTIQKLLAIGVDGDFGPATKDAVITFQKKKGISADGIVGEGTWTRLLKG